MIIKMEPKAVVVHHKADVWHSRQHYIAIFGIRKFTDIIMNHNSGFIIWIADLFFAKILIEHTPKTCLKKYPPTKKTLGGSLQ